MKISTRENDEAIDVRPLNFIRLYKWENESWTTENLSAGWSQNDRETATAYMLIPASEGHFSVYLECQGFQAVKTIGGKADGCWAGFIGYDTERSGWLVSEYAGTKITNYKSSDSMVRAHPDAIVNDCHFSARVGVEVDVAISFDLHCDSDSGYWILYAPPTPKGDQFNYVVSYANFTEKFMELGAVSISIDEHGDGSSVTKGPLLGDIETRRERQLANTKLRASSARSGEWPRLPTRGR